MQRQPKWMANGLPQTWREY